MKEIMIMNWKFYGRWFDVFNFFLRIMVICQNWVFDFLLKTMLMNPINHHDNHQGLFLFLITMQHW